MIGWEGRRGRGGDGLEGKGGVGTWEGSGVMDGKEEGTEGEGCFCDVTQRNADSPARPSLEVFDAFCVDILYVDVRGRGVGWRERLEGGGGGA